MLPVVPWEVEYTDEFKKWWQALAEGQQDDVAARVELLADDRFYEEYVPVADDLYDEHLDELRQEGLIE